MKIRTQEIGNEWTKKINSLKKKVNYAERMLANVHNMDNAEYWIDYRRTVLAQFNRLVANHNV